MVGWKKNEDPERRKKKKRKKKTDINDWNQNRDEEIEEVPVVKIEEAIEKEIVQPEKKLGAAKLKKLKRAEKEKQKWDTLRKKSSTSLGSTDQNLSST